MKFASTEEFFLSGYGIPTDARVLVPGIGMVKSIEPKTNDYLAMDASVYFLADHLARGKLDIIDLPSEVKRGSCHGAEKIATSFKKIKTAIQPRWIIADFYMHKLNGTYDCISDHLFWNFAENKDYGTEFRAGFPLLPGIYHSITSTGSKVFLFSDEEYSNGFDCLLARMEETGFELSEAFTLISDSFNLKNNSIRKQFNRIKTIGLPHYITGAINLEVDFREEWNGEIYSSFHKANKVVIATRI